MEKEKRLIDAYEYDRELMKAAGIFRASGDIMAEEIMMIALAKLRDAATVDSVEMVHGRWISLTDCANAGVYCSVCHKKVWKEDYAWCNRKNRLRSNYCPYCGAKMDKEA